MPTHFFIYCTVHHYIRNIFYNSFIFSKIFKNSIAVCSDCPLFILWKQGHRFQRLPFNLVFSARLFPCFHLAESFLHPFSSFLSFFIACFRSISVPVPGSDVSKMYLPEKTRWMHIQIWYHYGQAAPLSRFV